MTAVAGTAEEEEEGTAAGVSLFLDVVDMIVVFRRATCGGMLHKLIDRKRRELVLQKEGGRGERVGP